ncbi:MAG TPA: c-type cytochrome [Caulobacteraceae bacterium]|jgi:cytochrome c|nr:c-type cytochrome [Caulobacteraceae bacterium]
MRRSDLWLAALAAAGVVAGAGAAFAQAGDAAKGSDIYDDRCSGCHVIGGVGQGPALAGVVGRKAGAAPGFAYTAALKHSGVTWTPANLDRWLSGPQKVVPGTAMVAIVPDAAERRELIAYLATLK